MLSIKSTSCGYMKSIPAPDCDARCREFTLMVAMEPWQTEQQINRMG